MVFINSKKPDVVIGRFYISSDLLDVSAKKARISFLRFFLRGGKMRLSIKSPFPVSLQYPEYSERYFLENVQIKPS